MSLRKSEIAALLLLLWAGFSLAWSPDKGQGAFQLSHALLAVSAFLLIARLPDKAIEYGVLPGVALSLLVHFWLIWYLPADWYGAFGNKNFGAEYLMGAVPLCAVALWNTKFRPVSVGIALTGIICLFTVYAAANAKFIALLTLGLSVAGWLIYQRRYLLGAIIVLVPVDAMALYGYNVWTISSLRTRIELWANTIGMWLENPLLGHGFGSFNYVYPGYQEFHLQYFPQIGTLLNQPGMFSGAAHSEPLQLLAELGLIGFVLAGAFLFLLIRGRAKAGSLGPVEYGSLASIALLGGSGLVGFPLQNPATIVLAVIALGILARREKPALEIKAGWPARLAVASPVIVALLAVAVLHFQARVAFSQVRAGMERNDLPSAFIANLRAIETFPWDWLPKYQLALTLTALAVHDRQSSVEQGAADRVFEISRGVSPGAPILNYARLAYLDAYGRVEGSKGEIERLLAELRTNAVLQPSTWLAELWFAQLIGDQERASRAVLLATDANVIRQAGHLYPGEFTNRLRDLAKGTDEVLKGQQ